MRCDLKKLLSVAAATAIMLSSMSVVSYADADLTDGVDTLEELKAAVATGGEYTINSVITISDEVNLDPASAVKFTTVKTDVLTVTNGGNLTLGENVAISSNTSVLYATGTGIINVDGATIESTCTGFDLCYADGNGVINVTSGTLKNGTNIIGSIENSKVTVSGGTLTSTGGNGIIYAKNNANVTIEGDAVLNCVNGVGLYTNPNQGNPVVSVKGGTITATTALQAYSGNVEITDGTLKGTVTGNEANITITGGTFSDDVSEFVPENGNVGTVTDENGNIIVTTCTHANAVVTFDADNHWLECEECGGVDIDVTAHIADSAWTTADGKHYHACTEACGVKLDEAACAGGTATCKAEAVCSECNTKYGVLADHISDGGKVTTEATEATDGVRTYSCTECGEVIKTEAIPATGYTATVYDCTAASFTLNKVVTQTKTVVDSADNTKATKSYRFVMKISEADATTKYSKATVAISNGTTTKNVEIDKCYRAIVAGGNAVSETGYVYVAYTVTEVPMNVNLSATITLS